MAFFSLIITEHLHEKLGRAIRLPLVVLGCGSVLYWNWSEQSGSGDLRTQRACSIFTNRSDSVHGDYPSGTVHVNQGFVYRVTLVYVCKHWQSTSIVYSTHSVED